MDEHILAVNGQYDEFVLKLDKAKEFLRSQRFEEAKKVLLEIVAQEPNYVEANDFLYQIYEIEEDYISAAKHLKKLYESIGSLDVEYKLAQAYQNADDYENAYSVLFDLCQKVVNDKNVFEQMAHTCRIIGKIDEAIEYYDKILKIDKEDIVALTQLAEIYYDKDRLNFHFLRAKIYYLEGNYSNAVDAYKKSLKLIENEEEKITVHLKIAELYVKLKKYEYAHEEYQHILAIDPNNKTAEEEMGKIADEYQYDDEGGLFEKIMKILFK